MNKYQAQKRRAIKTRAKIKKLNAIRLSVHRTLKHIYVQLLSETGGKVLASASTLDKECRSSIKNGSNIEAATKVGKLIAERAIKAGFKKVAFDRSGNQYHGRVKALAQAAREAGLEF